MIIRINTDTARWHLCWAVFDLLTVVTLGWGQCHHYLWGPQWFQDGIGMFMGYRFIYHSVLAWKRRNEDW